MMTPGDTPVFTIKNLLRRYPGNADSGRPATTVHFPDDIEIPRGEMIGVLGLSGSGKTTLLNLLALMDEADGGSITFHSASGETRTYDTIYGKAEEAARFRKEKLGFVFQNDELLDGFSVRDNIQIPYWSSGKQLSAESLRELLRSVGLDVVDGIENENPADLSAGQRSRIGLLRAFSGSPAPEVIFADEPTANVDVHLETEIYRLLDRWRTDPRHPGRTILLSTHRLDIASRYCTGYVVISRTGAGKSEGVLHRGRKTEPELRELVVGADREPVASKADLGATLPYSRMHALWKFLFNDFWRHRRAQNSFLVSRVAPLLFILALFLFVWLGSFILGIRQGGSVQFTREMTNDLLWNTVIQASDAQMEEMRHENPDRKLWKSYNGFHRQLLIVRRGGMANCDEDGPAEQIAGRTMENEDPLLARIGESLVWPPTEDARMRAMERFQRGDFGIIVSKDALSQTLGYDGKEWPDRIPVSVTRTARIWMPVLAVAREIPNADYVVGTTAYAGYQDTDFIFKNQHPDRFYLTAAAAIDDNAVMERDEKRISAWLAGLGVEPREVVLDNIRGEQLWRVDLAEPKQEFDLSCRIDKNLDGIKDAVSGAEFPKDFLDVGSRPPDYTQWSVILEQDVDAVRHLIQQCYSRNMVIDTAVQVRVDALKKSDRIFRSFSLMLFVTALVLASVLLFTTTWFDSNRKVHAVGVMLGLGISRPMLIAAYALQFYLLIGALLLSYAAADFAGLPQRFANLLGGGEGMPYSAWSPYWWAYILMVLVVVPAAIALLRFTLYRKQPAELLNSRE